jgi:hypothetical protein
MSKHIVVTMVLMLAAGAAWALPTATVRTTYATEAELLAAPGSAGYAVGEELDDVAGWADADLPLVPLCDCEGEEGDEGEDDAGYNEGPDPGDGGEEGDDDGPGHEGDQGVDESPSDGDDEGGC